MIYIRRVGNSIRAMVRGGLSPFSQAKTQLTRLRTNNFFTQTGQRFRLLQNRLGHYMDAPRRYLGINTKGGSGKTESLDENIADGSDELDSDFNSRMYELGTNPQKMHQRMLLKHNRPQVSVVQHTQIHLFDRMSGEREILHLGFGSGRTKAQYIVNEIPLIFAQADAETAKTEDAILISTRSPEVKLNGFPLDRTARLLQGSELNIKGRRYHIDLQVNEQLASEAYVQAAWETDIGPVRRENQDALGIYRGDEIYLFAIADGVGSGYSGDKMSAYTINYLLSAINLNYNKPIHWEDILYKAIQNANIEVRNFLQKVQQHGGTTLTAFIIDGWTATISHVGDSRLYLLRNEILQQITEDHSEIIASNNSETSEQSEVQSILSKAVGKSNQIEPDLMTLKLQPNDRLLLCTDGITGRITDDELLDLLTDSDIPIHNLPTELVKLSNQRNNTDNASVIVIDILDHQTRDTVWEAKSKPRVYTGDSARLIELKKIEKSGLEKQDNKDDVSADEEDNALGCSCLVFSLLMLVLLFAVLWGSGVLYSWIDAASSTEASEQIIVEPSQVPVIVNTVTLAPRPTRSDTISLTELVTTEITPSPIASVEQIVITLVPESTSSEQISFEIVSPTPDTHLEATSTVRPTNPPR